MKLARLSLAVATAAALTLAGAAPANATVSGTNGAYTVSATGEPTALAVGQTATFTARVDLGSATICTAGTLKVNVPVGAGYTGTSVSVGTNGCGSDFTLSVTGVTAGTYNASVSFQYPKGLIVTDTWQIVVSAPDTTPPVVTITSPTQGASYFLGSVPAPAYTCTDAQSTVTSCTQSGYSTALGTHTMTATGVSAGGTASASVTYTVIPVPDTTPPVVTINGVTAGATYNLNVESVPAASCTAVDDRDGAIPCNLSGYGNTPGAYIVTGTATDAAGNTGFAQVAYTVIQPDITAPVVTINGVTADATYPEGSVPAASCTAVDDRDGAVSCSVSGFSTAVGTHTVTGTATDAAGNIGTASATYTVKAVGPTYSFGGFYNPVDMGGVINTVRAGKTVPLKFDLYANGVEVTDPALVSFSVAPSNVCAGATNTDAIEFTTTGGTSLRYDALTGQFIQNWKTPSSKGCYAVTATAGSASITAYFQTK